MQDPTEIWASEVPESSELGLHLVAMQAARRALALCQSAFPGYRVLNHIVGQMRFTALQYDLREFGKTDFAFRSEELSHVNGLSFTRLRTPRIFLTTATVESENAHPQMSMFHEQEQQMQLDFLSGSEILVANLSVRVDGVDLSAPTSITVHFPDGRGGYMNDFIDLTKKTLSVGPLPVEKVRDERLTPRREETQSVWRNDFA